MTVFRNYPILRTSFLMLIGLLMLAACTPAEQAEPAPQTEPEVAPAAATATVVPPTNTPQIAAVQAEAESVPTATPAAAQAEPAGDSATNAPIPQIALEPLVDGLTRPLYLTHAGDGSGRLFLVEQAGRILIWADGQLQETPFMDIVPLVGSQGNEQGLLGVAFHPAFPDDPRLFVNYTDRNGDTVVAAYQPAADSSQVDPQSARTLLTIAQPFRNHNGGLLKFGPDGYLYVGTGDGGSANDPQGNGQNLSTLLGKLLRLDVNQGDPYAIPPDNPFVETADALPEIWAYGLRNPWRFAFDRPTNDLYIADVGQNQYEEIHREPADEAGINYGWAIMEGAHCFQSSNCDQSGLVLPVAEYDHSQGCSVTGGYVYRGAAYPALQGVYLYGDFCSGYIWGLRPGGEPELLLDSDLTLSSFGEDEAGELYAVDLRGAVYRVVVP